MWGNLCYWIPLFLWLYLIDTFFQFIAENLKAAQLTPISPIWVFRDPEEWIQLWKTSTEKSVCVNGWCKYVCVCACLHLGLCQTLPSPAAILPPHPKLARAHTHMQNIPQEPRREWQAGAGGGETSQEANRCSPSGFSQVAYIKRRREKSRKRWKHPWGWAGRTHFFPRAPVFFFLWRKQFLCLFSSYFNIEKLFSLIKNEFNFSFEYLVWAQHQVTDLFKRPSYTETNLV